MTRENRPHSLIAFKAVPGALSLIALIGAGGAMATTPYRPAGIIRDFQVLSIAPAYGGKTPPGAPGPYEIITAVVHGALDPASPLNAGIVDLALAPRDRDGLVDYSTDVMILRPVHAADAARLLFYDVANRGRRLAIGVFIGRRPLTGDAPPRAGFPSLLRIGATFVWSGWQGGIKEAASPRVGRNILLGTDFPIAREPDGTPITGMSRQEFVPDVSGGASNAFTLSYPPADSGDRASVTFTARQSWLLGYGTNAPQVQDYRAPSVPVTTWHYVEGPKGTRVVFTPPASVPGPGGRPVPADGGTIYSFVYRARDPRVNGIGMAAIRDLVSFLRHDATDASGHPNPLADLAGARCVLASCPARPSGNFDVAIGEGISQSGRLLRDFLYRGFNEDAQGRIVFDGMMPIIAGARRSWVDARFSQPGQWSRQHEEHWQRGDQFPFTYGTITDPVSGRTDGLLRACTATHTCPRVMQVDGAFEWWDARASLVVTDGRGHDVTLPPNVRYYLVAGTGHGGGPGVTSGLVAMPAQGSLCELPPSPVEESPVIRALARALIAWVTKGTLPPPSRYPTVAAGTAVLPTAAAVGFPDLSDVMVPSRGKPVALHLHFKGILNTISVTDYTHAVPIVHTNERYTLLVPKVDANGNAIAGVIGPDLAVPLATYTGWNLRGQGHAIGEGCYLFGGEIPFAVNKAAEAGGHDSRATLAALYSGRADYRRKVAAAAEALVKARLLLQADAVNVFEAHAKLISPLLIPSH